MLTVRYHRDAGPDAEPATDDVLGRVVYGPVAGACAHVSLPQLGAGTRGSTLIEEWLARPPFREGRLEAAHTALHYRCNDELLFGWITVDEQNFIMGEDADSPLQRATTAAYRQIFAGLDQLGFPLLLRVWNFVPAINAAENGEERYRRFNVDRQRSFEQAGRNVVGDVPAATAVGSAAGALVIYFIAGRQPATPIENPRQVSAYHYPSEHGRKSPTFARGGLYGSGNDAVLLVSGTASIVGHQTVHAGDVVAQTRESLLNIEAVVDEANRHTGGAPFRLEALRYKTYVRHAADFAAVRAALESRLGTHADVVYLQADICRSDLLVEVEACSTRGQP